MITPAFSPTATERVLPRLALDFTTASLDPRITVTRALNTATRVNSNGYVETVNADLPRFDFDPVTKVCRGLLIEETRLNVIRQSQALNEAVWSTNAVVGTNAVVSPDGTQNAETFTATNLNATLSQTNGITANSLPYTSSLYIKYVSGTPNVRLRLALVFGTAAVGHVVINSQTGAHVASTAPYTITDAGNGWWRVSVTVTNNGSNSGASFQVYTTNDTVSTNVIALYGAQLELGAFATSYIPTTTASLTRNADVVAMTGTNFSNWWQATTGAMTVRARQLSATSTRPWAYISDGTANNIISLRGNVTDPELYIKATTDQVQIDAGTLAANASYGLSGAWNTNDCAAAFNGGAAGTDASATIPTVDRMLIGSDGTNYLSGWAEKISYWPQRITNAETQAFSK